MSAMSDYLEDQLRDHVFRTGTYTKPSNLYVALFTAAPNDAGGGTEVSGGSYARVQVATGNATWADDADGATSNVSAITFPAPTANWGTVTHFGVFDAATGGNLLFHGALTASRVINSGDAAPEFAAGALTFTFA